MKLQLVVATKNAKKLEEIRTLLEGLPVSTVSLTDFTKTPRIIENKKTFRENAIKKAMTIARFAKALTMGEDSGLCVDALGGKPGVNSARFAGKNKSDIQNNLKLLKAMAGVPVSKRKAHYICAVALADAKGVVATVEGRCDGIIGFAPRGRHGFGYDPLFLIPKYRRTFAELGSRVKHSMSHRYHALRQVRGVIKKYIKAQKVLL